LMAALEVIVFLRNALTLRRPLGRHVFIVLKDDATS